jgi:signal transduction histidine kinase
VLGALLSLVTALVYSEMYAALYSLSLIAFINPLCALYYALRLRPTRGSARWQIAVEAIGLCATALAVSAFGVFITQRVNGRSVTDPATTEAILIMCLLLSFPCVFFRVSVRLWLWWGKLRQRRLMWSLMHSHLLAVALLQMAIVLPIMLITMASFDLTWLQTFLPDNPPAQLFYRLNIGFLVLGLAILASLGILIALLPASAAVSYFLARRIRQRLTALMSAAHDARDGSYDTRVVVTGADEIATLQTDFNAMIASLETNIHALQSEREKVETLLNLRHEMIANVSHELRTPLATLRAWLGSLKRTEDTNESGAWIDTQTLTIFHHEVHVLQRLIDDLFTLSRAEADQLGLHITAVDLSPLVARIVASSAPLAWQTQRIDVRAQMPNALPSLSADEQRLEQALRNLVQNGIRHTLPGGIILISARQDGSDVEIAVRDSGSGIAPEDLPHIWERYYHDGSGTGLGLTLVKSFIEAMGGTVGVSSVVGEGTAFTLRLRATDCDNSATLSR